MRTIIRIESSSCLGIFFRALCFYYVPLSRENSETRPGERVTLFYWPEGEEDGRAASGGALAPQPPRATGVGPQCHWFLSVSCSFYLSLSSFLCLFFRFWDRTSPQSEIGQRAGQIRSGGNVGFKTQKNGFPTLQRRGNFVRFQKMLWEKGKNGMSDLIYIYIST